MNEDRIGNPSAFHAGAPDGSHCENNGRVVLKTVSKDTQENFFHSSKT